MLFVFSVSWLILVGFCKKFLSGKENDAMSDISFALVMIRENADPDNLAGMDAGERVEQARWGPRSVGGVAEGVSPVYSLAVHSEEVWGLAGSEVCKRILSL
jgi:hypothetical protein